MFAGRYLESDSSLFCGGGGTDHTNDSKVNFNDLKLLADNRLTSVVP